MDIEHPVSTIALVGARNRKQAVKLPGPMTYLSEDETGFHFLGN